MIDFGAKISSDNYLSSLNNHIINEPMFTFINNNNLFSFWNLWFLVLISKYILNWYCILFVFFKGVHHWFYLQELFEFCTTRNIMFNQNTIMTLPWTCKVHTNFLPFIGVINFGLRLKLQISITQVYRKHLKFFSVLDIFLMVSLYSFYSLGDFINSSVIIPSWISRTLLYGITYPPFLCVCLENQRKHQLICVGQPLSLFRYFAISTLHHFRSIS